MAGALVGTFTAAEGSGNLTTGSRTTTAGNLITGHAAIWQFSYSGGSIAISDNKSNSYTDTELQFAANGDTIRQALGYNQGGTRGTSHTVTATFTTGAGASGRTMVAHEWSGIEASPTIVSNTATGTGTAASVSATSGAASLFVGQVAYGGASTTIAVNGSTQASETDENSDFQAQAVAYRTSLTGANSVAWTLAGSRSWGALVSAFTEAGGDVTVGLTGQSATASRGTVGPATDKALTGAALTSAQGTVSPGTAKALTGAELTGTAGTLSPSVTVALSGLSATVSQGSLAASVGGDVTVALTGLELATAQGAFGPASSAALASQLASIAAGAISPATSKALTGNSATVSGGTLSPALSLSLTGTSVTISQGTLSAPGNVVVALSGLLISTAQGSLGPASAKALTGDSATVSGGSLVPSPSVELTGASLTASGGTLEHAHSVSLSGQLATISKGSLLVGSGDPTPPGERTVTVTLGNAVIVTGPSGVTIH